MRQLFKITTSQQPINRLEAIKNYKKLQDLRRTAALWIRVRRLHNLSNDYESIKLVQNFKRITLETINPSVERSLSRVDKGITIPFTNLESDVRHIREVIRKKRRINRDYFDSLANKQTGYWLKKYLERVFTLIKRPTESDSEYIGIEIECIMPREVNLDPLLHYAKYINVSDDGSIGDYDEDSEESKEIKVCLKKSELRTILPGILSTLRKLGAFVNSTCGLHVHLDQRNNQDVALTFQKLVRSLGLLYTVVSPSRRDNYFCKRNRHSDFYRARYGKRYKAINATAYNKYATLEVRLFNGTIDTTKIINWIEVLLAISHGKTVLRCPKNFDTALAYWDLSPENLAWLKSRQERFQTINEEPCDMDTNIIVEPRLDNVVRRERIIFDDGVAV